MLYIQFVLLLIIVSSKEVKAVTMCSEEIIKTDEGLGECIVGIKSDFKDGDKYWFGTSYRDSCPIGTEFTDVECFNSDVGSHSISSRTFANDSYNENLVQHFVTVYIQETPRKYNACGHAFSTNLTVDHYLDPVEPEMLTPIQSRQIRIGQVQPELNAAKQYTFIAYDPGFSFFHGFYNNIPGANFNPFDGDVIQAYSGPLYYLREKGGNPYIFLLFEQTTKNISVGTVPMIMYDFSKIMEMYGLIGPIAINKMLIEGDIFGVQSLKDRGFVNLCPDYITDAASKYMIPHVASGRMFEVSINTTFISSAIKFETCCNSYTYGKEEFTLDPIGDGGLLPVHVRSWPNVTFTKRKFYPQPLDFSGENYTLVMFDPDLKDPDIATVEKPYLHWLITDIPDGNISRGMIRRGYMPPAPPTGENHRYVILLYEETGSNPVITEGFTPGCMVSEVKNRCMFEIERFVTENNLELAGGTWFRAGSDPYLAYMRIKSEIAKPKEACVDIDGYTDPCSTSGVTSPVVSVFTFVVMLLTVFDI